MQDYFEQLLEDTYYLNIPMPVVSITELNLQIKKGQKLFGKFEIYNSEEGYFTGMVETINNYVNIKNRFLKGNHCIIEYEVDLEYNKYGDVFEDTIIITYNGGEILIPAIITTIYQETIVNSVHYIPKKSEKKLSIETNQASYHSEEIGLLKFFNPTNKKLKVTISNPEGYIIVNEPIFELLEKRQVEFSFKIPKLDKILGKIPLKTNPKIEVMVHIQITDGYNEQKYLMPIYITELKSLPSNVKVSSQKAYQQLSIKLLNEYSATLLYNTKNKVKDTFMEEFKSLINFDKTNIDLRLFYCYLAIEDNKKEWALKEINNIDRYLLYYDNENLAVSDLLLLFVELIKGESVQGLVSRWYPNKDVSWFKILLKNRLMTHNHSSYSDYKALYLMGIKNRFIFTDAVILLNSSPLIPIEEDQFYRAMLTWAVRKRVIGARWLKKIENNFELLLQNNNINGYIAEQLYKIDSNKNMLTLLCAHYLKCHCTDEKALIIFEKAIDEKVRLEGLEIAYIQTAYNCNKLINIGCLKMNVRIDRIEEPYRNFFLLNILIGKDKYKHLYFYYIKAIEEMTAVFFKDALVPSDIENKTVYIKYLLETNQYEHIVSLYRHNKLEDLGPDLLTMIAHCLYATHPKQALEIAKYCYDNSINHEWIMQILVSGFKGSLSQLLNFNELLKNCGLFSKQILEEIIVKGILTRKYPEIIMEIYVDYYNLTKGLIYTKDIGTYLANYDGINIHQIAQQFIAAQILIEELQPSTSVIKLLERIIEGKENTSLYLALLKSYIKSSHKQEELIHNIIQELVSKEIVFSWYLQLVPKSLLGERVRIQQYFEYNSVPGRNLVFNYRLDDDEEFTQINMKHVALGLYIVSVVMFYNEGIQFYIEEVNANGNRDIKSSDIYINREITDQEESETLFDLINTIEISKEMNDAVSMEKTVAHYIMMCNKEIENMNIL